MYKKHEEWWPQVRIVVRSYNKRKKKRTMQPREREEVKAVEKALDWVKEQPDGEIQLKMYELYHIRQTHELKGAAEFVGYSYASAVAKNHEFMRQVAKELQYESDGKQKQKKRKQESVRN